MEQIISKLRDLIDDNLKQGYDQYEYLGVSNVFTLTEPNVQESSIDVYKNGIQYNGSGNWSFNSSNNKLTVEGLTSSDIIEVDYQAYLKYSDNDLKAYIRAALVYISVGQYQDFVDQSDYLFPTPTEAEENLIGLVASILIKDSIRSYRTPEFTLNFAENMSKEEKIKKAITHFKKTAGAFDYADLGENVYGDC